jgi:diaminopimelate decarboxylase
MRISTNSEKFGVEPDETKSLLETAQDLNLKIKGVTFNYQEEDQPSFKDYQESLVNARAVFD